MRRISFLFTALLVSQSFGNLTPFKPTTEELRALYQQSNQLGANETRQLQNWNLTFTWIDSQSFFYRRDTAPESYRFTKFNAKSLQKSDLFDHAKLAGELEMATDAKSVSPDRLPVIVSKVTGDSVFLSFRNVNYSFNTSTNKLTKLVDPKPTPQQDQGRPSPDRKFRARINEGKLQISPNQGSPEWKEASDATQLQRIIWSPDSKFIALQSQIPGDRRTVSVLDSTKEGPRAELRTRLYDQPGDKLDTSETYFYNLETKKTIKVDHEPVICGGHPWADPPTLQFWTPQGQSNPTAILEVDIRGFQQKQILEIDPSTAKITTWIDEKSPTFIHYSQFFWRPLAASHSMLFRSERDGWAHIYEYTKPGEARQITKGNFVVRSLEDINSKTITFTANGRESGDPYFIHYYTIHRDGSNLTDLTPQLGSHKADFSPDRKLLIDSYSTVTQSPTYELRNDQGKLLATIEKSTAEPLRKAGINGPTEFVAKGRDGKTDIYGIIHFPSHFDPNKTYPIIEDIYAGPHDSFVPKTFRPVFYQQRLAELGFIVVQIDGMGTANRGKAFHDVCWKNVADAGLPDRIAWMKAAAEKFPQMDTTRVGVYGTSAGGQSSTGALLFHPEFYKVGVSSCGCHDNRMDKYWWNEQWMGYPIGPHYAEQSNITNAAKLQGNLLLMVGEVDSNVPPESTFRLLDALQKAKKDVDFVYLPGADHTAGGEFGEHKRRDFFVKHLLGVDPPSWSN
jgi:dipeptidyl aminopeptidase/acylaminoacyl peptidase